MSRFKSMVDTPKRLDVFRATYGIPDDIGVRYIPDADIKVSKKLEIVVIPLMAFVEGGVRILMSKLLTKFLRHFELNPDQCTPNQ